MPQNSEEYPATVKVHSLKGQKLVKGRSERSPGVGDMITENRSDIPNEAFQVDGESIKPFTSRNVEFETQFKPAIAEDPDEETKSDKAAQQKTKAEEAQNQYATIADNLPASATEIDPTPVIKADEAEHNTLIANPEDGKILEDT